MIFSSRLLCEMNNPTHRIERKTKKIVILIKKTGLCEWLSRVLGIKLDKKKLGVTEIMIRKAEDERECRDPWKGEIERGDWVRSDGVRVWREGWRNPKRKRKRRCYRLWERWGIRRKSRTEKGWERKQGCRGRWRWWCSQHSCCWCCCWFFSFLFSSSLRQWMNEPIKECWKPQEPHFPVVGGRGFEDTKKYLLFHSQFPIHYLLFISILLQFQFSFNFKFF